ncbi:MAG: hypothetical protein ABI193_03075 [Minicystis sp.]
MSDKTTYTPEEWSTITEAPAVTGIAVAIAGASGLFGTLAEAFSTTSTLVAGMKSENPLIRAICTRDDLMAAQNGAKAKLKELMSGDLPATQNKVRMKALELLRQGVEAIETKGSPEDAGAYRAFVHQIGEKVANAAKEGGFLGFGGERVSEGERTMLAAIDQAIGATRA